MADNFSISSIGGALKRKYAGKGKSDLIAQRVKSPLMDRIPKDTTSLGGEGLYMPLRVNISQTRASTTAQAQTNSQKAAAVPLIKQMKIDGVFNHSWKTVDHETLIKTKGNDDAFWNAIKMAAEEAMVELADNIAHSLYRAGYGAIGVIDSNDSSATITLTEPDAINQFHPGLEVVFSASESSDALRDSGDSLVVQSVDRDLGKVTFSTALSNIALLANGDYIFVKSDRENSATPARLKISGLAAWGPATKIGSGDSFNGVDRSVDSRLQFGVVSGSLSAPGDALRLGAQRVAKEGKDIDAFLVSHNTLMNLMADASSQIIRDQGKDAVVGLGRVFIQTGSGPKEVLADVKCQDSVAWGVNWNSLKLYSIGDTIELFNEDGLDAVRQSGANGLELRYYSCSNVAVNDPASNVRINLS